MWSLFQLDVSCKMRSFSQLVPSLTDRSGADGSFFIAGFGGDFRPTGWRMWAFWTMGHFIKGEWSGHLCKAEFCNYQSRNGCDWWSGDALFEQYEARCCGHHSRFCCLQKGSFREPDPYDPSLQVSRQRGWHCPQEDVCPRAWCKVDTPARSTSRFGHHWALRASTRALRPLCTDGWAQWGGLHQPFQMFVEATRTYRSQAWKGITTGCVENRSGH